MPHLFKPFDGFNNLYFKSYAKFLINILDVLLLRMKIKSILSISENSAVFCNALNSAQDYLRRLKYTENY